MLRTGWTRPELNAADPDDVARIMWAIESEVLADMAEQIERAIGSIYVPDQGTARATALLDRATLQDAVNQIDSVLEGPDDG